jgi:phosphatidylserine decarboxylase
MKEYGKDSNWPFAQGGGSTIGLASGLLLTFLSLWRLRPSFATRALAAIATIIWGMILYFFRDPNRTGPDEPGLVVSAGDGEVVAIVQEQEEDYVQQEMVRISIFLSILDVHVQRIPVAGMVRRIEHRPGKFLQAFRPEASTENEYIAMVIDTEQGPVLVKQIAGIMARRCVNHMQPGASVKTGQRFGLIKFGSRVDLFLPPSSEILVTIGDKAYGGLTPMARLQNGA